MIITDTWSTPLDQLQILNQYHRAQKINFISGISLFKEKSNHCWNKLYKKINNGQSQLSSHFLASHLLIYEMNVDWMKLKFLLTVTLTF